MKRILSIVFTLSSVLLFGQTVPQGINYQAVALDQSGRPIQGIDIVGRPIDDAEIGVRLTILENSPTGSVLYQEEHEVLTDLYGMFNLVIGQGLQVSPDPFSSINWQGDKYLQVELSIDNNGSFTLSAVQQLMSVPYAFLAENALVAQTVVNVDDADADPTNELQGLSLSNDTLYLSNGGFVVLPTDQVNDADADPTNELQILSLSNDTIYLTSGGFVVLPTDQVNDADDNPTNEIQTLSKSGSTISLTQGGSVTVFDGDYNALSNAPTVPTKTSDLTNDSGFITAEVDGSTTNEIQTLSKTGSTISLTQGGSVTVFDGDYNSLTSIPTLPTKTSDLTNDSGFITAEVDGSTTNELQTLSISNDTLYLTDGGFVLLPMGFDGDYNNLTNTPSIPTKTSDLTNDSGYITAELDSSTTNELQTLSISNDTIFLSNGGYVKVPINSMENNSVNVLYEYKNTQDDFILVDDLLFYPNSYPGAYSFNSTNNFSRIDTITIKKDSIAVELSYYFKEHATNNVKPTLESILYNQDNEILDKYSSNRMNDNDPSPHYFNLTGKSSGEFLIVKHTLKDIQSWTLYLSQPKIKAHHFSVNQYTNGSSNSKSLTNKDLGNLFGLKYTGNGSLGDYFSNQNPNFTGKFLNYDDFFLLPGDTFDLPSSTTVLLVQDTCYIGGIINGLKSGTNYRGLGYNTSYSDLTTYNGIQAASGTNNTTSNYTGTPKKFNEGIHNVKWNEWSLLNYLNPYQSTVSDLNNDTSFMICAAQYGDISGQDGGSAGTSHGAYGGHGGKGLIIVTKTLILENAIFDLRGKSGTNSPNTTYAGGAGGGGSLFISYEDGSIQNPIILNSGGSALSVYTTTPLTNGANGRVLYYQR